MPEDPIPVYVSSDDNYVVHLCTLIDSIVENTRARLHFIILVDSLSDENKSIIIKACGDHQVSFVNVEGHIKDAAALPATCEHISIATCYRYFIPELPFKYKKGIYLDCDVIVRGNLLNLFEFPLGDNYIAAVEDTLRIKRIGGEPLSRYFNSGVMLMNIEKMRTDGISAKLYDTTIRLADKLKYFDQDALNIVLSARAARLPPKWNAISPIFRKALSWSVYTREEVSQAIYDPQIIHFTGPDKPWKIPYGPTAHPWTPAYFYYLSHTPLAFEREQIIKKFDPAKCFFGYWKRHINFFARIQYFKMRRLYSKNLKIYSEGK